MTMGLEMTYQKIVNFIDRWGMIAVIFLLPWQARIIFRQGYLAGAPSEPQTMSLAAIEVLLIAMLIVRTLRRTVTVIPSQPEAGAPRAQNRVLFIFGFLILLALFSVLVSIDRITTLLVVAHLAGGIVLFYLITTAPYARDLTIAFVVSMVVQSLVALEQTYAQRVFANTWLGVAAHDPSVQGTSVVEAGGMRLLRAYGTFPHPNILGGAFTLGIILARSLFRRLSPLAVLTYTLLTIGLFLTFSRLAWIALGVGMSAQLIMHRKDKLLIQLAGVTVVIMIMAAVLFAPFVAARVGASGRLEAKSFTARFSSMTDAFALFSKHPFTGVGLGNFSAAIHKEIDTERNGYALEPAHSVPLVVLAELGIFGGVLFLYLLWILVRTGFKTGFPGLALALVVFALGDHWAWTTLSGILIFWAGWGIMIRTSEALHYTVRGETH